MTIYSCKVIFYLEESDDNLSMGYDNKKDNKYEL